MPYHFAQFLLSPHAPHSLPQAGIDNNQENIIENGKLPKRDG
ncbi:hypothetical protein HMPREF0322_03830 [Desulfitobacterium hafniense DP7]|uniref:Uncharacterized protein n=1 Tax=Desulfitobacterium hafniense DP7 TaxID=537010 RepID=G9XS81_DESHA|nr:hypothetical protein HMPREF0322_03830 [Desulfitobacterium hafniense DP7]